MRLLSLALALVAFAGCRSVEPVATDVLPDTAQATASPVPGHENLHAVLWTQTSVEYGATTQSIYRMAQQLVDDAMADTTWTADLTQRRAGGYGTLRPAVVMDVDETVLDNSAYQARLIEDGGVFTPESWDEWVQSAGADIVPGAAEFVKYAQRRGVLVVFLTNRTAEQENATLANLGAHGIAAEHPLDDLVLTRGEKPEWDTSDKEPRRAHVRSRYRILLYFGDNLGDFVSGERADLAARERLDSRNETLWGRRWIMLPNPQYGSWEGALFGHDYTLPADSVRAAKYRQLKTLR